MLVKNLKSITIFILLFIYWQPAFLNAEDCVPKPIKYISTFRSSRMWKFIGGDTGFGISYVRECVNLAKKNNAGLFFIPVILDRIKDYFVHSNWTNDEKEFTKEVSNFLAIILQKGDLKIIDTDDISFCNGLTKIKEVFYQLCEDDDFFYKMIYTMDDGPFYGINTDLTFPIKDSLNLSDINAKIYIRELRDTSTLELVDKNGLLKWKKIIARSAENYINNLHFADSPIKDENELGYKIGLFGSGEYMHLYLRSDGSFRLYYHSW